MGKLKKETIDYIEVKYKPNDGPVVLEVLSGFATLGEFVLLSRPKDVFEYTEWGKDPKRIDDNLNDIFIVPFDLDKLENYYIAILGKYSPSPRSNQIKVEYLFLQNDKEIKREAIEKSSDEPFERFTHRFKFKKQP